MDGVDDIRPLADEAGKPTGFLLVLRHFTNLMELRNWRDVCSSLSFEDDRLGVREEDDTSPSNFMKTTLNQTPVKGKGKGKGPGVRGVGKGRGRGRTVRRQIDGVDFEERCNGGFGEDDEEDESFGGGNGGGGGGGYGRSFGGGSLISAF